MEQKKEKVKPTSRVRKFIARNYGLVLTGLIVVAVVGSIALIAFYVSELRVASLDERAAYAYIGDYFGGILNPLLAFLALIALLMTILIQSEELRMTTKELRKSAEALQKQISLLEVQAFANTFFQLLRQHNEIVNDISIRVANGTHDGRDCFSFFVMEFNGTVKQIADDNPGATSLEVIEKAYSEFSENYLSEFGHYFRNLYNIIKFVDESGIDERSDGRNDDAAVGGSPVKERKRYTNLIRAQLSSYELILLYYNCLWSGGCGRFKRFADRYELLDNLELPRIAFPKTDAEKMELFGPTAFGPQSSG